MILVPEHFVKKLLEKANTLKQSLFQQKVSYE